MINFLKELFSYRKRIKAYQEQIMFLSKKANNLNHVLASILGRKVEWLDVSKFNKEEQRAYYIAARDILNNIIFQNFFGKIVDGVRQNGFIVKEAMDFCLRDSATFEQIQHTRTAIAVIEKFRDEIENIPNPDEEIEIKEPYSSI